MATRSERIAYAKEADRVIEEIKPLLAGIEPSLQGAILCDLTALWLAGFPGFIREELLQGQIDTVRKLIPINEEKLFGPAGHPQKGPEQ